MSLFGATPPNAPDPTNVANTQQQYNNQAANYSNTLAHFNQYNPYGSATWSQTGVDPNTGAPIYAQSINLNPTQQSTLNNQFQTDNYLSGVAGGVANKLGANAGNPVSSQFGIDNFAGDPTFINQQAQNAAYNAQTQYLDPQYQNQFNDLTNQLANQGVMPGSDAYNRAMQQYNLQKQQAYSNAQNQAILTGSQIGNTYFNQALQNAGLNNAAQGQSYNQNLANANLPYQQLAALNQMAQVTQPQFQNQGTAGTSAANYATPAQNAYQGAIDVYNAQNATNGSLTNGLFSLGAAGIYNPSAISGLASGLSNLYGNVKNIFG